MIPEFNFKHWKVMSFLQYLKILYFQLKYQKYTIVHSIDFNLNFLQIILFVAEYLQLIEITILILQFK